VGGANLNFFPFGTVARRSGMIFIRRSTRSLPTYRYALRSYIGHLIRCRQNLGWSIEGGRTRTGKLRPPVHGILRYVVDAVQAMAGPEVMVVPVSIVYDQLHEVAQMTSEARGGAKSPEGIRWLVDFARSQRHRLGQVYLNIGEPLALHGRLAELDSGDTGPSTTVERVAVEVCHRINRATPVTPIAVVCVAMLAADRALTLAEVLTTVAPLTDYLAARSWPVAGAAQLNDLDTIRRTLHEMVGSGVLACYERGTEPVWRIRAGQHLVAAFYRNTAIHALVARAICELALVAAAEAGGTSREAAWAEALRVRELLKFEFFFSSRAEFAVEMQAEIDLIDPHRDIGATTEIGAPGVLQSLDAARPLLAHLVLRPFLEAYLVVADRLVAHDATAVPNKSGAFDDQAFLVECLQVGRQWVLQRRLASDESVSLELFTTALRLARHRNLVESTEPELGERRRDFAAELAQTVGRIARLAERAQHGELEPVSMEQDR
jgi:glycerol-3-phosphate O-acyltransferase